MRHVNGLRSRFSKVTLAAGAALVTLCAGLGFGPGTQQYVPNSAPTPNKLPREAEGVGVQDHLGKKLPMQVEFRNSDDKPVQLGDYFKDGKPAILVMAYYRCPVVCTVVLDKVAQCMQGLDYTVGKDYRTLVFSFDPTEKPAVAKAKKDHYVSMYSRGDEPGVRDNWEFHTGSQIASQELADALGFQYKLLPNGEYSHPVLIFVITGDGRVARYIGGYDYDSKEMKLTLLEATQGKIASSIGDILLHFCYRFDPNSGKYVLVAFRVMQIGGVISIIALGSLIGLLFAGERLRRRRQAVLLAGAIRVDAASPEAPSPAPSDSDPHPVSRD